MISISNEYDPGRRTLTIGSLKIWWPFPICEMPHSSSAVVLGYSVYGDDCPKIIDWLHTVFSKLVDGRYWIMHRFIPKHRYHIINTGLPPGYHCEDSLILHACMVMLCRYIECMGSEIEIEKFNKDLRTDDNPNNPAGVLEAQASRQEEALNIYRWWKNEKPKDEAKQWEMTHKLYGLPCQVPEGERKAFREELWKLDEKIFNDEQTMLERLIKIRPSLWT